MKSLDDLITHHSVSRLAPDQNLAFSGTPRHRCNGDTCLVPGIRKFDAKLIEMASINIQERRIEAPHSAKVGINASCLSETIVPRCIRCRPNLYATTQDDCACLHLQPHKVACSHQSRSVPVAFSSRLRCRHPHQPESFHLASRSRFTIRRSNLLSGISVNVNLAVFHLTTYPVTGIAVNFDGTTTHHGPQMHPNITMNGN